MAFEVRSSAAAADKERSVIAFFTDEEWWNLLALAHECGFDPGRELVRIVYPRKDEGSELGLRRAQQLYIGVNAVLNQDTLPFATTWETEDGRLHFRWIKDPRYERRLVPPGTPADSSVDTDFQLEKSELKRLRDHLYKGPVFVKRIGA
ncbi:MAG TPA: hypothetical protein VFE21_02875 [Rubrobacteraceae bacterium]|nr:hypothetical protein [Rubrobacteraceae bacterium]